MRSGPRMVTSASARITRCLPLSSGAAAFLGFDRHRRFFPVAALPLHVAAATVQAAHVRKSAQAVGNRKYVRRQFDRERARFDVTMIMAMMIWIERRRPGVRSAVPMRMRGGGRQQTGGDDGKQSEFARAIDHGVHPIGRLSRFQCKVSTNVHSGCAVQMRPMPRARVSVAPVAGLAIVRGRWRLRHAGIEVLDRPVVRPGTAIGLRRL